MRSIPRSYSNSIVAGTGFISLRAPAISSDEPDKVGTAQEGGVLPALRREAAAGAGGAAEKGRGQEMKIALADPTAWDYTPEAPYRVPLGGAHSAACYLAEALAGNGHEVHYACHTSTPGQYRGVNCVSWKDFTFARMRELALDAIIVILGTGIERELRQALGPQTRLILWTGHADDQPGVAALGDASVRGLYDGFAMVSDWQRQQYLRRFSLDPARTAVLRNAIAPAFANLFAADEPILAAKAAPPVLAYTSTPFRGLKLLPEIFPQIRARVPGARLRVFSSMEVYKVPKTRDEAEYGALYRQLRQMEGVELIGSLPQPALAPRLREAVVLAYPNTFVETSCISVMEAMAAGCRIVTSDLGALPETTAGFGQLVPVTPGPRKYIEQFVDRTVQVLAECAAGDAGPAPRLLREQVDFTRVAYTWPDRAREWAQWIGQLERC